MTNLRYLLWLERKRLGEVVAYVLRIFGVDRDDSTLYAMYVGAFFVLWAFTVWAYLLQQIEFISRNLSDDVTTVSTMAMPLIIFMALWIYLILSLRESPLKMSAPDLVMVATSPVPRSVLALFYWLKSSALFAILIAIVSALVTFLLTSIDSPELAGKAGGWSFVVALALTWSGGAIVWSIALLKLHLPFRRYKFWFWLIPPVLFALFALFPAPFMLMGNLWSVTINAAMTTGDKVILLALVIVSTILLMLGGTQIHLAIVADESQRYARIQRLGILGQVYARDVIARINRQTALGSRSRRYFKLARTRSIPLTLWQRAFVSMMRLAPMSLLNLLFTGARYTAVIVGLFLVFGWKAPQVWLIVAIMILQFRPTGLIETFQQTMQSTFIRQFLPLDNMPLVILADSSVAIIIATIGGWLVLLTQTRLIAAFVLVPIGLTILTLTQALTWFKSDMLTGDRIAYEYSTLTAGLLVIGMGYFTGDLWMAVIAGLMVIMVLIRFIRDSRL